MAEQLRELQSKWDRSVLMEETLIDEAFLLFNPNRSLSLNPDIIPNRRFV